MILQTYTPVVKAPRVWRPPTHRQFVNRHAQDTRRVRPTREQLDDWGWYMLDDMIAIVYSGFREYSDNNTLNEVGLDRVLDDLEDFISEAYGE